MSLPNCITSSGSAPIGLFDSGVGGLSVYLHLAHALPDEHYVYYADTLNVPYGNRSSSEIYEFTMTAVEWLYQQGCKLIVIACNSASAHALDAARLRYPQLPIVGLVPALKPAVLASQTKHVAVLATKATLQGRLLNQVIGDIAKPAGTQVQKYFDPQLVPWVEAGMPLEDDTAKRLLEQVTIFHQQGVDHLVLGCTHYPLFKPLLQAEIQRQNLTMTVLDSGAAIASRVQYLLSNLPLKPSSTEQVFSEHNLPSTRPAMLADNVADGSKVFNIIQGSTITKASNTLEQITSAPKISFYASDYYPQLGALVSRLINQPVILLNEN